MSPLLRFVRLLVVLACGVLVPFVAGVASASADVWTTEGSTHYLKNDAGGVIKSWTAKEWLLWRKEVQSVGECMGVEEHCAAHEFAAETPVEDVPRATAEHAQEGVHGVRAEGRSIAGEVQNALDYAGEVAGTLPTELGASAIAGATLGSFPRIVGVELGNGLDQLFELPEWHPATASEEERISKAGERIEEEPGGLEFERSYELDPSGTKSAPDTQFTLVPGSYVEGGAIDDGFGSIEEGEECTSFEPREGCKSFSRDRRPKLELHNFTERQQIWDEGSYYPGGILFQIGIIAYEYQPPEKCPKAEAGHPGLIGAKETSTAWACPPVGAPAPGLITAAIEENNVAAGLPKRPKATAVVLPTDPPSSLNESDLTALSESLAGRERIESMFPGKAEEERELEEKELFGGGSEGEPDREGCSGGKPVNCATGNQFESQTDLSVAGRGPALDLTLTYNSRLAVKGLAAPFGVGWTSSYSAHVELRHEGEDATVYQDNGSTVLYARSGGAWTAPPGLVQATLVDEGSGYVYTLPDQTALHFNSSGWLTSEVDRNGNTLTMSRNGEGRLEAVKDAAGREITLKYNAEGEVESAADPMGHTVKYTYEAKNLATVTLPGESSASWQYKYNTGHELTSETDGRGYTSTTEYNSEGEVSSETDALHRKREWSYKPFYRGSETTITEPNGAKTVEGFNEMGSPTSVTRDAGTSLAATTFSRYDSQDELLSRTNPDEHKTEYGYDEAGDRTSEKNPDGDETKWEYDSTHDITSITMPTGEKTTVERDSHGNAIKVSRPAPGETTQATKYKYDGDGDVESMIDPLGHEWKYEYDSYGDRSAETDPEANKRTWGYNEDSLETSTVSPRGHVTGAKESSFKTTIERDAQGRVVKVTDPLGHETKYAYDADSDLASLTDPVGNKTTYAYDEDDEPTKVEQPNKATEKAEYNAQGEVIAETDGNAHTTKYERNPLGEITEEINPLSQKTTKEYDAAGNLTAVTDAEKRTTTYKYDPASRLIEVSYSDGKTPTVKYEYNADGNRTKMTDGTGESTNTYDQLQRITETKDGHGDTVKYEYNLDNSPTKITYPNGKAITRAYDNDDRLKSVTDWLEHTTKVAYSPESEVSTITYPTGTSDEDTYAYEDDNAMSEVFMKKSTETLASLVYARNKDDEVTKATSKGLPGEEKPEDTYDENSRLTKGSAVKYAYDAANNPTTIGEDTYTYNNADEPEKSKLKTATVNTYTYNEVGQRTKTTPATGSATTYGYDQASNLTSVARPKEGEKAAIEDTYAYNGEALRASQTITATTSYLTWDTAEEIPLILNDGTYNFIYGPNGLPIEQINSGGTVTYLHHDQAGSTRLLTGSTGTVTGKCTYNAYGSPTCEGTTTTPLGYDGQYTNSDTGFIYMRDRVYDPATAQFLTVDPLEAVTAAPYSYARDNPVSDFDPTGLFPLEEVLGGLSTVVTVGVCLTPGVDVLACGPAIAANTLVQSTLVLTSSRSPGEQAALVATDVLLGGAGSVFAGIDDLAQDAPGWITAYQRGAGALVPSLPGLLEPSPERGSESSCG